MLSYILRRLLLVVPTLWAIITINFFIIQIAPGGPVEQAIAQLEGNTSGVMERFTGGGQEVAAPTDALISGYKGSRGLDPQVVEEITRRFGFDKPIHERYFQMLKDYATFNFGESLFRGGDVIDLIVERFCGFHFPRIVEHAAHISDFDSFGDQQSDSSRLAF